MKVSEFLRRCLPWANLPLGLLVALLQRTPAVKVFAGAGDYVLASRAGEFLRATLTAATLGALHSLAGATTFVQQPANPIRGTVGTRLEAAFTYNGTPSPPASFRITSGSLPPGVSFIPAPISGTIRSGTPAVVGTPTQAGTFTVFVQGFNAEGLTNNVQQALTFEITGGTPATAPVITGQPQGQSVAAGASATFSVQASGSPAPTFQWTRNGVNILGATGSSLTLSPVQTSDAGSYAVVVTNTAGTVTSNAVTLTVTGGGGPAPVIVSQPISVTAATGSTAALTVVASGSGALSYQWRKDGAVVAGATDATLRLPAVTAASAGAYSVVVTSGGSSSASNAAQLAVAAGAGRLANLSVRTNLGTAATLIVGFATNGTKTVLIRGIGPTLGGFGVPGAYTDPQLELYSDATMISRNDDWNVALEPAFGAVGAFPLAAASKDAAMQSSLNGPHTAHIKGPGSGVVLCELYDSGTGTTQRLINVSARNLVGTGDNILIAGFVVDGTGGVGRTLLIRAVGPTLAGFGVSGALVDPKLEIYSSSAVKLVENDNWSATLAATAGGVGAFPLATGSADAALLVTLPPGAYSAQVSGIANGTGEALVEVYEVP